MWKLLLVMPVLGLAASLSHAQDRFERLNTAELEAAAQGDSLNTVSPADGRKLKAFPGGDGVAFVLRTDGENWSKARLSWGFRKGADKPIPVVVLDRHITLRKDGSDNAVAAGQNVMLFPGFEFDFDIGQIVPTGMGGDLTLLPDGTLKTLGAARLYHLDPARLEAQAGADTNPADHEGVLARDFSGAWKLDADGRWQGTLTIKANDKGAIVGEFFSADTGSLYPVAGEVVGQTHRARFTITFSNAIQAYEGHLWTTDKSRWAGTMTMAGKPFGFVAVRQK